MRRVAALLLQLLWVVQWLSCVQRRCVGAWFESVLFSAWLTHDEQEKGRRCLKLSTDTCQRGLYVCIAGHFRLAVMFLLFVRCLFNQSQHFGAYKALVMLWNRDPPEKLTVLQRLKKMPACCGTQSFLPVHYLLSHVLTIHFNITILSTPRSSSWSVQLSVH